jgi:hypothetical protein
MAVVKVLLWLPSARPLPVASAALLQLLYLRSISPLLATRRFLV